jgi:ubiquinone/menaquinone biosynthesis C-methylase UbiE
VEKEEYQRLYDLEEHLWWFVGMRAISLTLLDRFLPPSRPLSILDVGCGTGGMLQHLGRFGTTVGIDISPDALRLARLRDLERLALCSALQLPFPDECFDLVTSFDVIYHRAVPNDESALAEMARVLRRQGLLLIRVPAYDRLRSRHDEAVHTRQRYGHEELDEKLRIAGFHSAFLTHANCILFPAAVTKRFLEKLVPGRETGSEVESVPAPLNRLFTWILGLEARILRRARLPFGLSLVAVAQRGTPTATEETNPPR